MGVGSDQVRRWYLPLAVAAITLVISACAGGSARPADPSAETTSSQVAPPSLPPASEDATPVALPSTEALPSVEPPSGEPSAPAVGAAEYTLGADDLAAFIDAYAAAHPDWTMSDTEMDLAGARLCTYLQRHADASGHVEAQQALVEADVNEPGYAWELWAVRFDIALGHYCGEFTADFTGLMGG